MHLIPVLLHVLATAFTCKAGFWQEAAPGLVVAAPVAHFQHQSDLGVTHPII